MTIRKAMSKSISLKIELTRNHKITMIYIIAKSRVTQRSYGKKTRKHGMMTMNLTTSLDHSMTPKYQVTSVVSLANQQF